MTQLLGWLFVLSGGFAICGAVCDWEWFMNRIFVTLLSRTGARIFYILLGAGLIILGVLAAFGIIDMSQSQ
ncbi:MAG TPA: immunity 17 family protein [Anaerohalosphaeraceae bacterium]|jgi:hypothetical protein|nr:immunity 17 family protein [Anaerohalosphaeraceae bacterium]HRT50107.1 immunity 17 family protein [Anaerohalosphaeraceae bacterium]HRT86041.1 immunity 17 family protein [Anaerohalosphaeraceae bacterium]